MVIVHLAIHTPKPDRVDDLLASMRRFAAASTGQPGLREVHAMRDRSGEKLVGLAIWDSHEAFEAGVRSMRAAVEGDPFDEWEDDDPEVYLLEEA